MDRQDLNFYFHILRTLEELSIPYVVIGAFAGSTYGVTRTTGDVDIVVDLNSEQIEALAAAYPSPRYYADPYQMRDSIRMGILFNIIDSSIGRKVDLIPLTMAPGYGFAMRRRIRRTVPLERPEPVPIWVARPEDVIVGKLMAWQEGRSIRHEMDIRDMLIGVELDEDPEITEMFDYTYIDRWVERIGEDAADLWESLKQSTQTD